jgi:ribosomal-protein-alanine acetyltransferase
VITIRKFHLADLPRVMQLERASFGSEGYSSATFLAHAFRDRKGFLIAEDEAHQLVGYALARMGLPWLGARKGGLTSIAVAPAQRRRGIGRALMEAALAYLREHHAEQADLEVNVTNRAAQSLYESFGFKRAKLLPNYYGQGRDGLQMALDLKQLRESPANQEGR